MKFQKGDQVAFIHFKGSGTVEALLPNGRLLVKNEIDMLEEVNSLDVVKVKSIPLQEKDILNAKRLKSVRAEVQRKSSKIDLHLQGDYTMGALDKQLAVFLDKLDKAYVGGYRSLEIVHGVGEGILRGRLLELLEKDPRVARIEFPTDDLKKYASFTLWLKSKK